MEPPSDTLAYEGIDDAYLLAFGRFTYGFGQAESMLHNLLLITTRMSQQTAAALFPSMRAKEMISALNRYLDLVDGGAQKAALSAPFAQFGLINDVRNDLLHYGPQSDAVGIVFVTNASRKHLVEKATTRAVSRVDLEAMAKDLSMIRLHFVHAILCESAWKIDPLTGDIGVQK